MLILRLQVMIAIVKIFPKGYNAVWLPFTVLKTALKKDVSFGKAEGI